MFEPKDFLELSKDLFDTIASKSDKGLVPNDYREALLRTVAGRAYYAVYLTCREWLWDRFEIDLNDEAEKRGKSVHKTLVEIMYDISKKVGRMYLVDQIKDLKRKRILSDYDLKVQIDERDAEYSIEIAESILEDLRRL